MTKGDTAFYKTHGNTVRCRVERMHRDGTATVTALFFVSFADPESNRGGYTDAPGYLGIKARMDASGLRASAY